MARHRVLRKGQQAVAYMQGTVPVTDCLYPRDLLVAAHPQQVHKQPEVPDGSRSQEGSNPGCTQTPVAISETNEMYRIRQRFGSDYTFSIEYAAQ